VQPKNPSQALHVTPPGASGGGDRSGLVTGCPTRRILDSEAAIVLTCGQGNSNATREGLEIEDLALVVSRRTLVVEICSVVLEAA
jgi:hypothetical protein